MAITPNLLLDLPEVSETIGPTWASMLNDAMERIDAHTHATDSGVKITPAGMNINATLEINSQDITEVNSLSLDTRASAPSTLRALYSKSGDLYFKNTAGTEVQVTNGGTIAGTPGSITNLGDGGSSAVFSDINEDFTWFFDGVKPAAMNMGDIRLYPFDGSAAYTNFVTLKSPTSLASSYSITMPGTAPAQSGVWSVNTSGVIQNGLHAGTAANPSMYWSGDENTGLYSDGADTIKFSTGGTLRHTISTTAETLTLPIQGADGDATTPAFSFSGDTDLGVYRVSANILGLQATQVQAVAAGNNSTPQYSFIGDSDSGFYRGGANNVGVCAGTVAVFDANTTVSDTAVVWRGPAGSVSAPTWTFANDPDTGIYNGAADGLYLTTGGTQRAIFNSDGPTFSAGICTNNRGNAERVSWAVFTGTLAANTTTTLDPGGSVVLGATGSTTISGSAGYSVMPHDIDLGVSDTNDCVRFSTAGFTDSKVQLVNRDSNSSNDYRVVVYYQ